MAIAILQDKPDPSARPDMSKTTEALMEQAQQLAPNERLELVDRILGSLDEGDSMLDGHGRKKPRSASRLTAAANCAPSRWPRCWPTTNKHEP